jgi:O-antigen/teichoic acid export membrane protein
MSSLNAEPIGIVVEDAPIAAAQPSPLAGGPLPEGRAGGFRVHRLTGLLRTDARRAAAWNAFNYGVSLVLRLVGSMVLTRLLAPDDFGIMALLNTFLFAFVMFSDVGIGPSIVQSHRDDAGFINTAWTMQVVRGFGLWAVSAALAYPLALLYDKPEIATLLPVLGFTNVVSGFFSTSLYTLNRRLHLGRQVVLDVSTQVVGQTITIFFAWSLQSVWALVIGSIAGPLIRMVGTHFLDRAVVNRFHWERAAARAILGFGGWIFVSSFLTFMALQLDNVLLGKLLTREDMGLYNIAKQLGQMLPQICSSMGAMVIFPYLARVVRETPDVLGPRNRKVRLLLLLPASLMLAGMTLGGHWLVDVLYDARWADAGWMLQIFAAGAFGTLISLSYGSALLALGKSRETVVLLIGQITFMLTGSLLGYFYFGPMLGSRLLGFIIGYSATEWLNYPVVAGRARKHHIWNPDVDALVFAVAAGAIAIGYLLRNEHLPHLVSDLRHSLKPSP